MGLRAFRESLRRRGWIIAVVAIWAAALTFGISLTQTKLWQATATISALPASPDPNAGEQTKDLFHSFITGITTYDMANTAIQAGQLDMQPGVFLSKISVTAEPDGFLLRIAARDQDPLVAAKMALALATAFRDDRIAYNQTQAENDRIAVKLIDSVVETHVYRPNPIANTAAGLLLGGLAGLLIIWMLDWMEADVLATAAAVERCLALPVLGALPGGPVGEAHASGAQHAAAGAAPQQGGAGSQHGGPAELSEAYQRLRMNLSRERGAAGAPLQTVLVAAAGRSDAGGPGVAANLAAAFARLGIQTVLVDCNLRAAGPRGLPERTGEAGLSGVLQDPGAHLPLLSTGVPGLRRLAGGPAVESPVELLAAPGMGQVLAALRREADLVLMDAQAVGPGSGVLALAGQVDCVLLAVRAGHTKLAEARRAQAMLSRVGARVAGVVLTNVAAG